MADQILIKIGTRGSPLALWQAEHVAALLERRNPNVKTELVVIKTKGDKILDVPLAKVGGKGLFVKEIEESLLDGRTDMAVHSMKDVPSEFPPGLCLAAIMEREDPRDALICSRAKGLLDLPPNAKIGTSSLRRSAQLLALMPDLQIEPLRGNIGTRLDKLTSLNLDAIVLAAAGVKRMAMDDKVSEYIPEETVLPAVGQGAMGIEIREDDPVAGPLARALNHEPTQVIVTGERAFLKRLDGGCQVPVAAHGRLKGDFLQLTGVIAGVDGTPIFRDSVSGKKEDAKELGVKLAEKLLNAGGKAVLDELLDH
ncbi:hydroxymethylbilane synthase [Desulfatibacillum aliphaticivorans]|uniref:Porphobilinogen deaminase n=1 Tax=Desulfatibacillum aliphaticivorans TaxID=218208 RepID=B8FJM7_DESAL|nr:hydroxymethylbilane synthase [Desulfatibacillum aliphaticivorans]ACL05696.1 porphobilinogen deaminase [Desulfatibacillum aliphaticivorans]